MKKFRLSMQVMGDRLTNAFSRWQWCKIARRTSIFCLPGLDGGGGAGLLGLDISIYVQS